MRRLPSDEEAAEILKRRRTRPARRPPPSAGRAVGRVVRQFDRQFDRRFGPSANQLQARWKEIVGETLWRVSEPVKVSKSAKAGAALELRVEGPAAAIVQHQAEDIIARVNLVLGDGAVARLRIVQGPVRRAARPLPPKRRPPLDAAQEAELARGLSIAPDGPLKTALLKLGRAVMRED